MNPLDPKGPKKWYVTQMRAAQSSEDQVAFDIAEGTTLNPSEAMMVLRQLRNVLLKRLLMGETVKLGNWGSFSLSFASEGVDEKKDVLFRSDQADQPGLPPGPFLPGRFAEGKFHLDRQVVGENPS